MSASPTPTPLHPGMLPVDTDASGRSFAAADDSGQVCVVDLDGPVSGGARRVLQKHTMFATAVAFKPSGGPGMELASGGFDCKLVLWYAAVCQCAVWEGSCLPSPPSPKPHNPSPPPSNHTHLCTQACAHLHAHSAPTPTPLRFPLPCGAPPVTAMTAYDLQCAERHAVPVCVFVRRRPHVCGFLHPVLAGPRVSAAGWWTPWCAGSRWGQMRPQR
jgi:hypothetical protein